MESKDQIVAPHNTNKHSTNKRDTASPPPQPPPPPPTPVKEPSAPTTSKNAGPIVIETDHSEPVEQPWWKRCCTYLYDSENSLYCGRTCISWLYMILYSIMYSMFVMTYMMIFLYATLTIIKMTETYLVIDKSTFIAFSHNGIGLTATPTTLENSPLISYTNGHSEEYSKYVKSIDELLVRRRKRQVGNLTDLGPCGSAPYGYGVAPCIIIRPNKQMKWSAKPMKLNSTKHLPKDLQRWLELKEQKLWLHCSGYNSYDKEHIGSLKYYPYPPGFDPSVYPLEMHQDAPLIAIQISNFTLGLSLTVECKLWYDSGVSSVAFLLYVEHKSRSFIYKRT